MVSTDESGFARSMVGSFVLVPALSGYAVSMQLKNRKRYLLIHLESTELWLLCPGIQISRPLVLVDAGHRLDSDFFLSNLYLAFPDFLFCLR
jgi:hypothetical protein